MRFGPTALPLTLMATAALAGPAIQSPSAPWKTFHTAHYRIHFPATGGFEDFAREVAQRIEGMHSLMEPWVGHAYKGPTDVLVLDPVAAANGMTFSYLDRPHLILWRTPPDSEWEIAHGRDWVEELVPHELVHLHHLTLPNRKPSLYQRLQFGPRASAVADKSPGWVKEGYATLLEGRITGMGRPHSAYRAMVLRLMAREGRLPVYKELDKGQGRYLVSSAFLGWLEQQHVAKEKALPLLWQRLSSPRYKTFAEGFRATFGQGPETAYARFRAELSHDALEVERRVAQVGLREGELWGFVPKGVQDLSLSPDGTRLLGRVLDAKTGGLCLWDLQAPLADVKAKAKEAKRDPELPEESANLLPEREVKHRLGTLQDQLPARPRWSAEGIRYWLRESDAEGVLHRVERTWTPTKATGAPTIEPLVPTWEGRQWIVRAAGKNLALPFEPMGPLTWDVARKRLFATRDVQGVPNLVQWTFDPAAASPFSAEQVLTRSATGALYPAPTPDGKSLYFMVPRLQGAEIRRLDLGTASPLLAWTEDPKPFAPGTVRPPADEPGLLPGPVEAPPSQPYAIADSHQFSPRAGFVTSPSGTAYQAGVGGRDILPRLDWALMGSYGYFGEEGEGPRGFHAGLAWRGWAWTTRAQVFSDYMRPSRQRWEQVQGWDQERRGFNLGLERQWWDLGDGLKVQGAFAGERIETLGRSDTATRSLLWGKVNQSAHRESNGWSLGAGYEAQAAAGRTESQNWNLDRASLFVEGAYRWAGFGLSGELGHLSGSPTRQDRFQLGGQDQGLVPSSLNVNAVFQPALPLHLATGDRFARWRAESLGFYVEGLSLWDQGMSRPAFLRVAGWEAKSDSRDERPWLSDIVRRVLGATEIRLGVHKALDGPMRNKTVFTLALLARY